MPLFAALVVGAQIPEPMNLAQATTLKRGEVIRYYERGGRSRRGGIHQILIVATPTKVFVKSGGLASSFSLSHEQQAEMKRAIGADARRLRSNPRHNPGFPSMADGVDVFLAYRGPRRIVKWTNERYDLPADPFPVMAFLEPFRGG